MNLFNIVDHGFVKESAAHKLSDNIPGWPQELMAQLFNQHPFFGKYLVDLQIESQDPETGYMYGFFTVTNPPAAPAQPSRKHGEVTNAPSKPAGPVLRVPVIVEDNRVFTFDVLIDPAGAFWPVSEERVAAALFNTNPFVASKNSTSSGSGQFFEESPSRASGGQGGASTGSVKVASVVDRLSINPDDYERVVLKVANDRFMSNQHTLVDSVARWESRVCLANDKDVAGDAALLEKVAGGFNLHTASRDGFVVSTMSLTNGEAFKLLPVDLVKEALVSGVAGIADADNIGVDDVVPEEFSNIETAKEAGVYAVMHNDGVAEQVVVLPHLRSLDGQEFGGSLVISSRGAGLQEKVAGIKVKELGSSTLAGNGGISRGDGVLVIGGDVYGPVTIKEKVSSPESVYFESEDSWGVPTRLIVSDVMVPYRISDEECLVPKTASFLPLTWSRDALVIEEADVLVKVASAHDRTNAVTVRECYDGGYDFFGRPVECLGKEKTSGLSKIDSVLLLELLGATAQQALEKLGHVDDGELVQFVPTDQVVNLDGVLEHPILDWSELPELVESIKSVDLTKEASLLSAPESVDNMLSLNFVTPENIASFVEVLPEFEGTMSKLAELLISVRLGVSDIPDSAVSSALRGMSKIVAGLRKLELRLRSFQAGASSNSNGV
jgi:hypothetical protein